MLYNNKAGYAFEKAMAKALGVGTVDADGKLQLAPGWKVNKKLDGERVDLFENTDDAVRTMFEFKTGKSSFRKTQLDKLAKVANDRGCQLVYIFSTTPPKSVVDAIKAIASQYNNPDLVVAREVVGVEDPNPVPLHGSLPPAVDGSADSPEEALEYARVDQYLNDDFDRWAQKVDLAVPPVFQPPAPPEFQPPNPPVVYSPAPPAYQPPAPPVFQAPAKPGQSAPPPYQPPAPPPYWPPSPPPYRPPPPAAYRPPAPPPYQPPPAPLNLPAGQPYIPPAPPMYFPPPPPPYIPPPPPAYQPPAPPLFYPPAQFGMPAPPPYQPPPPPLFQPPAPPPYQAPAPPPYRPPAPPPYQPPPLLPPAPPGPQYIGRSDPSLGGVDFSTLQLNSVSDLGPDGAAYSFAMSTTADDTPAYGGARVGRMAMDALTTFLVLPAQSFWVNLQPGQADRTMDRQFGQTEAGKVMLEADLAMKRLARKFISEDAAGEHKYIDTPQTETKDNYSSICTSGARQWIEPKPAVVHTSGNQLFILQIPLDVKIEFLGGDLGCPKQAPNITKLNNDAYEAHIRPKIVAAVNNDPEFADLRRVYVSRVAAEWFRQRNATHKTVYSQIIDTGDMSLVRARESWSYFTVFSEYIDDYYGKYPGYTKTVTLPDGRTLDLDVKGTGGVLFDKVQINEMPSDQFSTDFPVLATTVQESLVGPRRDDASEQLVVGGFTGKVPEDRILREPIAWTPWVESQRLATLLSSRQRNHQSTAVDIARAFVTHPAVCIPAAVVVIVAGTLIAARTRRNK